jgi:hypothetical protein
VGIDVCIDRSNQRDIRSVLQSGTPLRVAKVLANLEANGWRREMIATSTKPG